MLFLFLLIPFWPQLLFQSTSSFKYRAVLVNDHAHISIHTQYFGKTLLQFHLHEFLLYFQKKLSTGNKEKLEVIPRK